MHMLMCLHFLCHQVRRRYQLLGRLTAIALRDKFVLPLPLSHVFLRLVQVRFPLPIFSFDQLLTTKRFHSLMLLRIL
jgi:hypothetical protein